MLRRRARAETIAPWLGVARMRRSASGANVLPLRRARARGCCPKWQRMQRHRQDQFRLGQQGASAALQPAGEGGREVEPVGMFERQDRAAAVFVIAHDGAGAVEGGRSGVAGGAKRLKPGVQFEGNAATGAKRAVQENNPAPAAGAEAGIPTNRLAAGQAERRKEQIERGFCQTVFHPHAK
jgi:hypothetical protein